MKHASFLLLLPAFLMILLLTGCASSERMLRLSGGVVQDYSVPKDHRLRSEKYQSFSRKHTLSRNGMKALTPFDGTLVNLWPFFFRSGEYVSVLWPFFDRDPYGLALRPFYNQEGDDHSILFPLCAWNTAAGKGWLLTGYWTERNFGFFPLFHQGLDEKKGFCCYTPLVIHSWERNTPVWTRPLRGRKFTEALLCTVSSRKSVDTGGWEWLFRQPWRPLYYPDDLKREFAYRFRADKKAIPADVKSLDAYRKKIFSSLPDRNYLGYGFFPLFWRSAECGRDVDNSFLNLLGPVFTWERSRNNWKGHVLLSLLFGMESRELPAAVDYGNGLYRWMAPVLLSGYKKEILYDTASPEFRAVRRAQTLAGSGRLIPAHLRPEIASELAKLHLSLPPEVTDRRTLDLFLRDSLKGKVFPVQENVSGEFLPLFIRDSKKDFLRWAVPALLTMGKTTRAEKHFFSLPLFTYWDRSPREETFTILPPVGVWQKKRVEPRIRKPIADHQTYWVNDSAKSEFQDRYGACFLWYHGVDGFYAARKGWNGTQLEKIRAEAFSLPREVSELKRRREQLEKRTLRHQRKQPKDKIEFYRKCIEQEEIRIESEKIASARKQLERKLNAWQESVRKTGLVCDRAALLDDAKRDAFLETLFDTCTELRRIEDWGNGLLFRREQRQNGDGNYQVLWTLLAAGEKIGEKENSHLFHFLYRYRRDGQRSETVLFPFISIQQDGNRTRTRFFWKLFERVTENGKTVSGTIFFIPFGKP